MFTLDANCGSSGIVSVHTYTFIYIYIYIYAYIYIHVYILTHLHLDICASKICHQRLSSSSASWSPASSTTVTGAKTRTDAVDLRPADDADNGDSEWVHTEKRNDSIFNAIFFSSSSRTRVLLCPLVSNAEKSMVFVCFCCTHQWPRNSTSALSILPAKSNLRIQGLDAQPHRPCQIKPCSRIQTIRPTRPENGVSWHTRRLKKMCPFCTLRGDFWDFCYVAML